jgi:hypothetical protein
LEQNPSQNNKSVNSHDKIDIMLQRVNRARMNKNKNQKQKEKIKAIEKYWVSHALAPSAIFNKMEYLGNVSSKRNVYYCYILGNHYLRFTELKEITRLNIYLKNEIEKIYKYITSDVNSRIFSAGELTEAIRESDISTARINMMQEDDTIFEDDERDPVYFYLLDCCYILTAMQKLKLLRDGRKVLFEKMKNAIPIIQDEELYTSLQYRGEINPTTTLFENEKMFFTFRLKNFRGSMYPYIKEEIEYLSDSLDFYHGSNRINIEQLMDRIDFSQRFHKIYSLIEYRNIRNDRPDRQYFLNRIKSGLEIISCLHGTVRVVKEGRQRVFIKT